MADWKSLLDLVQKSAEDKIQVVVKKKNLLMLYELKSEKLSETLDQYQEVALLDAAEWPEIVPGKKKVDKWQKFAKGLTEISQRISKSNASRPLSPLSGRMPS